MLCRISLSVVNKYYIKNTKFNISIRTKYNYFNCLMQVILFVHLVMTYNIIKLTMLIYDGEHIIYFTYHIVMGVIKTAFGSTFLIILCLRVYFLSLLYSSILFFAQPICRSTIQPIRSYYFLPVD